MTYLSQETSVEGGRPIDLYEFALALQVFRYTSAEDDQVVGGNTYSAIPIKRGKITQGQESRRAVLSIELPADDPFPSRYVTSVPSERATVTIRQFHRGDGELATLFVGVVSSVAFSGSRDGRVAQVAVSPPVTALARQVPRFTFRGQCNNVLGDGAAGGSGLCTVDLENPAFKLTATVTAQTGLLVTVPGAAAFGADWFTAGTIETLDGLDARMILDHAGDVLTLHIAFPFPIIGSQVVLRAGCAHDLIACGPAKFTIVGGTHDIGEYQGFAFVPTVNIFESGIAPGKC